MSRVVTVDGVGTVAIDPDSPLTVYRVLLVDDDAAFLETTVRLLNTLGIERVDSAVDTPQATQRIQDQQYDAILVDVDLPSAEGHDWLLEHAHEMVGSFTAILTGHDARIKDLRPLEQREIEVVVKSTDRETELFQDLGAQAAEKREAGEHLVRSKLTELVAAEPTALPQETATHPLESGVRAVLLDWLRVRLDRQSPAVRYSGRSFSVRDIEREIEGRTTTGDAFMRMFINHLRRQVVRLPAADDTNRSDGEA